MLIYESHKFNGTSELLDILAAIISGFAIPLREEHVRFFKGIIIPLHKVQTSNLYFDNLIRCSMLFLSKDNGLAIHLLEGMWKYWPFANFTKELLFLQELPEVLEFCEVEKLKPLVPKLFKRIGKCLAGSHIQLADKAMCLFESDAFVQIVKHYKAITFNILVPIVSRHAGNHWNKQFKECYISLKDILYKLDSHAFDNALKINDLKSYEK
jgi:serine/threonine-protein phosphatase 2A regulatory subunit B'